MCFFVPHSSLHLRSLKTKICAVEAGAYPEWRNTDVAYQLNLVAPKSSQTGTKQSLLKIIDQTQKHSIYKCWHARDKIMNGMLIVTTAISPSDLRKTEFQLF